MNKKEYYLFIILILFFSQSCTRPSDNTEVKPILCTPSTPYGNCENDGDICYLGNCVSKDSKCGEVLAPCEDATDICIKDSENGGFKCVEGRCSYRNTNGTCKNDKMICTSKGICRYKCSSEYTNGACNDTQSCIDGNCVDNIKLCSNIINNGICNDGKTCSKDSDGNYKCLNSCSKKYPDGACTSDKRCYFNKCYFEYEVCGDKNIHGVCDDGKICEEGVCKRICSPLVVNGVCEYDNQICFNGECSYKCSETRPNGYCEEVGTKCVSGECKFKCSQTIQDGYCDDVNKTCVLGYCKPICSSTQLTGGCVDKYKVCDNGECKYSCSHEHPFGVCEELGYGCKNGECIKQCSTQFPTGACEQFFNCNNGVCEEVPCSQENLNGPCSNSLQKCIQGICLDKCSEQQPNGWCNQEDFVCYNNICIDPTTQPCSLEFKNGFCTAWNQECVRGECLKRPCSQQYLNGRCDNGGICNNGVCSLSCADDRPILQEGENKSLENGGITGSCCVLNEDCQDGFDSYGNFPTNICIYDSNAEGPYCIGLQLTKNLNDNFLCGFIRGGCTGCLNDNDCIDPYADYGTEQKYFCSQVTYYNFEVQTGRTLDVNISYCQRVFNNCQRLQRQQGESCNVDCNDSECATGLHCIKGICTGQCKDDSFCVDGANCIPVVYHLSDTEKDLFLDVCLVKCDDNTKCHSTLNENFTCSTQTYAYQVLPEEIPAPKISYCRSNDTDAPHLLGEKCTKETDCKNRICGEQKLCTVRCNDDGDCGNNAYCDYNILMTGEISHNNREGEPLDLNYLGFCRYLESNQGAPSVCSGKNDCPNTLVNGKEYQCLPKFDLLKNIPEGKSGDSVYGRCGVLKKVPNKAYSSEGEPCNNSSQLCDTDLCVCGNKLCSDGRVGKCRDYCEDSTDCSGDKYCKRIKVRNDAQYSKSVYSGVCISRNEGGDITNCNMSSNDSGSLCDTGKTCIPNSVNIKPEGDNPNKFGVEYICVAKKVGKVPLNQTCETNRDCNSQLCDKNTNKCSHACTNNSQCNDVGNTTCNLQNILVNDLNPENIVFTGICE